MVKTIFVIFFIITSKQKVDNSYCKYIGDIPEKGGYYYFTSDTSLNKGDTIFLTENFRTLRVSKRK